MYLCTYCSSSPVGSTHACMGWSTIHNRIALPLSSIIAHTKISLKIQTPQEKKKRKLVYLTCTHCAARTAHCSGSENEYLGTRHSFSRRNAQPPAPLFRPQSQTMAAHPLFCSDSHFTCPYLYQHSRADAVYLFMRWQVSKGPGLLHVDTCIWNIRAQRECSVCVCIYLCPESRALFLRGLRVLCRSAGLPTWSAAGSSDRIRMIDLQPLLPLPRALPLALAIPTWGGGGHRAV